MIPLHALVLILMGRFTTRLYVAYSSWYRIGTLASMQVPFVGFQPVRTSEHMAALGMNTPTSLIITSSDCCNSQPCLVCSRSLLLLSSSVHTFRQNNFRTCSSSLLS